MRFIAILALATLLAACGDSTSPGPAPQSNNGLTVISPNGEESFQVGGSMRVRWSIDTLANSNTSTLKFLLSCGNGPQGMVSLDHSVSVTRGDTTFALTDSIPNKANKGMMATPTGTNCKLRLQDYSQSDVFDTSDASFTVAPR